MHTQADEVIDKSTQDLWSECKRIAPEGFDAIFDANGAETLRRSYNALAPTGKLIAYGAHTLLPKKGGRLNYFKLAARFLQLPRFHPLKLMEENKTIAAFNLSFLFERRDLLTEAMKALLTWLEQDLIRPPLTRVFALESVAEAHEALESGRTVGKLVLKP